MVQRLPIKPFRDPDLSRAPGRKKTNLAQGLIDPLSEGAIALFDFLTPDADAPDIARGSAQNVFGIADEFLNPELSGDISNLDVSRRGLVSGIGKLTREGAIENLSRDIGQVLFGDVEAGGSQTGQLRKLAESGVSDPRDIKAIGNRATTAAVLAEGLLGAGLLPGASAVQGLGLKAGKTAAKVTPKAPGFVPIEEIPDVQARLARTARGKQIAQDIQAPLGTDPGTAALLRDMSRAKVTGFGSTAEQTALRNKNLATAERMIADANAIEATGAPGAVAEAATQRRVVDEILQTNIDAQRVNIAQNEARINIGTIGDVDAPGSRIFERLQSTEVPGAPSPAGEVRNLPGRSAGVFQPGRVGDAGETFLNPRLIQNSDDLAVVATHEEGHSLMSRLRASAMRDPDSANLLGALEDAAHVQPWRANDGMAATMGRVVDGYRHTPPHGATEAAAVEEILADLVTNLSRKDFHRYIAPEAKEILEQFFGRLGPSEVPQGNLQTLVRKGRPDQVVTDRAVNSRTVPANTSSDLMKAFQKFDRPGPGGQLQKARSASPPPTDTAKELLLERGLIQEADALQGQTTLIQQEAIRQAGK